MKDNMIAARQFANLYATAAMVEPKIQDKSFTHPNGNDNAFAKLQKEGLALYVKALNREAVNGGNVTALGDKLLKTAQKAVEEMDKNLENGRLPALKRKRTALCAKHIVRLPVRNMVSPNKINHGRSWAICCRY